MLGGGPELALVGFSRPPREAETLSVTGLYSPNSREPTEGVAELDESPPTAASSSIRSSTRRTSTPASTGSSTSAASPPSVGSTKRRSAQFVTPIPKPRKAKSPVQPDPDLGDQTGIGTAHRRYDPIPVINELRKQVDVWRAIRNTDH